MDDVTILILVEGSLQLSDANQLEDILRVTILILVEGSLQYTCNLYLILKSQSLF